MLFSSAFLRWGNGISDYLRDLFKVTHAVHCVAGFWAQVCLFSESWMLILGFLLKIISFIQHALLGSYYGSGSALEGLQWWLCHLPAIRTLVHPLPLAVLWQESPWATLAVIFSLLWVCVVSRALLRHMKRQDGPVGYTHGRNWNTWVSVSVSVCSPHAPWSLCLSTGISHSSVNWC